MVSFWPWKGDSSSTALFEKTLSALSVKVADTQSRLDRARTSARRNKVLWTFYLSFAYLVYAIVLLLVVGYKNLGAYEWTGMAGGPVLIYGTRAVINAVFNFRIETLAAHLKEHQEERAKTIQKLKDANKYDSTLKLIERYSGSNPEGGTHKQEGPAGEEAQAGKGNKSVQTTPSKPPPNRTRLPPSPTANIQRREPRPGTPGAPESSTPRPLTSPLDPGAEFAPNAFSHSPQALDGPSSAHANSTLRPPLASAERHWYDRIFDVLLGEDEMAPKNRIALVCQSCRLVNGQAPPGTRTLADLGVWRCLACGAANGETDEGEQIVREVVRNVQRQQKEQEGHWRGAETSPRPSDEGQEPPRHEREDNDDANDGGSGNDDRNGGPHPVSKGPMRRAKAHKPYP